MVSKAKKRTMSMELALNHNLKIVSDISSKAV